MLEHFLPAQEEYALLIRHENVSMCEKHLRCVQEMMFQSCKKNTCITKPIFCIRRNSWSGTGRRTKKFLLHKTTLFSCKRNICVVLYITRELIWYDDLARQAQMLLFSQDIDLVENKSGVLKLNWTYVDSACSKKPSAWPAHLSHQHVSHSRQSVAPAHLCGCWECSNAFAAQRGLNSILPRSSLIAATPGVPSSKVSIP